MKSKRISKKLNLNKKTIANLNVTSMRRVYGGFPNTLPFECGPNSELTSCTLLPECQYTKTCNPCAGGANSAKICPDIPATFEDEC